MNTIRFSVFLLLALVLPGLAAADSPGRIRIVLVGDSTVTDHDGWGLGFRQFIDETRAEVINTAQNGRSSMSFIKEGRWEKALALKGDYYLIQFGHNDEPGKPGRSTTLDEYRGYMNRYVDEARAIGAKPVLVTCLVRRQFDPADPHKINSSLVGHVAIMKEIAAAKHVPLLDLHARSKAFCEQLGRESCLALGPTKTVDGKVVPDNTHLNAQGSVRIGRLVTEELRKAVPELAAVLRENPVSENPVPPERKSDAVVSADASGTPATVQAAVNAEAVGPDPKEIPVPAIKTPMGTLPGANELPECPELPDVLTMNDGAKVATPGQWKQRREEMKRTLAYYAVGRMPPPPGNVKGREVRAEIVLDGKVRYRLVHLTFGPGESLALDIGVFTPVEGGPFPAIILHSSTPPGGAVLPRLPQGPNQGRGEDVLFLVGPTPSSMASAAEPVVPGQEPPAEASRSAGEGAVGVATADSVAGRNREVFRRGYALVMFNPNDCAEDTTLRNADGSWAFRNTRFYPAYPGYDWGILAGWAWGVSRIADFLETDPAIDPAKLIVTGASRYGKSTMIAAAFDERLMGAPVVTGGGGVGAYRFAGPRHSESLDVMVKKYPNWFSPNLHEFWGRRERLPFDQHWFLALCAPRPFLALEGETDTISLPEAVRRSMLAARPAYALLGAKDRLGVNYARHGHAFTPEDWTAIMDFADKYLRGMRIDRTFDRFPE